MLTLNCVLCNHWNELTLNLMFSSNRLCLFNPVSHYSCLLVGLMEHTKRLLRAFFELSQTHRGEWLIKVRYYYVLLISLVHSLNLWHLQANKIKLEHNIDNLHRSQFISASVSNTSDWCLKFHTSSVRGCVFGHRGTGASGCSQRGLCEVCWCSPQHWEIRHSAAEDHQTRE